MSKREVSPQFSVWCVCVCVLYGKVLPDMKLFLFFGPGGVVVNSNRRNQLFAHRVLESTFAASLCNLSSIFEKCLFL